MKICRADGYRKYTRAGSQMRAPAKSSQLGQRLGKLAHVCPYIRDVVPIPCSMCLLGDGSKFTH